MDPERQAGHKLRPQGEDAPQTRARDREKPAGEKLQTRAADTERQTAHKLRTHAEDTPQIERPERSRTASRTQAAGTG